MNLYKISSNKLASVHTLQIIVTKSKENLGISNKVMHNLGL